MVVNRRLERASVMIASGSTQIGSGYYVGDRLVVTCHHVADKFHAGADIEVWFEATDQTRRGKLLRWSVSCDVAIVEVASAPDEVEPLKLDVKPDADTWQSYAFPGFAAERSLVLEGQVDNFKSFPFGVRSIQLYSPRLHDQPRDGVGGISGAPVVCNEKVIGHFQRVLGAPGEGPQARLGMLYAVPAEAVQALLMTKQDGPIDGLCVPRPGRQIATENPLLAELYARITQGNESLDSLRKQFFKARAMEVSISGAVMFAAERFIARGQPADALEVLELVDGDRERASELRALALSLRGKDEEASELLNTLSLTPEAGGIRGGALKRRWAASGEKPWLQSAYEMYRATFFKNRGHVEAHYPGINAATVALLLGYDDKSAALADDVEAELSTVPEEKWTMWHSASRAEGHLLRGRLDDARAWYARAAENTDRRNVAAMRRQARLILERQGRPRDLLDDAFPALRVAYLEPGTDVVPEHHERLAKLIVERANAARVASAYCSGLNAGAAVLAQALSGAGVSVTVFLPDRSATPPPGARAVHLGDGAASSETKASDDCEVAALAAAREMGDLLEEDLLALRIGRDVSGEATFTIVKKA
jgi:hypothetical protein